MFVYLSVLLFPVFGFFKLNRYISLSDKFFYNLFLLLIIFFIGFRYGTSDFYLYLLNFEKFDNFYAYNLDLGLIKKGDFGYNLLNWVLARLNFGFYSVNVICAIVMILSIKTFKNKDFKDTEYFWLIWIISFQTFVLFLSMGYVRQGFAIFFLCFAIKNLINRKILLFLLFIFFSYSFHKSSIIFLSLIICIYDRYIFNIKNYKFIKLLFLIFIIFVTIIFGYLEKESLKRLAYLYLGEGMHMKSQGVNYRLFISVFVATLFLIYKKNICQNIIEKKIYTIFSFFVFLLIPISLFSSTFADRMLLYTFPLQVITLSRISNAFPKNKKEINNLIVFVYLLIFVLWWLLSNTSVAWLPYKNYFFFNFNSW